MVLVLVEGRPRIINRIVDKAGAILMAYNPGNEGGQAVADVLFGDFNPSGKLPFTYPRTPNGLITYDHKPFETEDTAFGNMAFKPQFEFGQGLSYTTFAYSDLRLGQKTITGNADLSVSVTVTNSGVVPARKWSNSTLVISWRLYRRPGKGSNVLRRSIWNRARVVP